MPSCLAEDVGVRFSLLSSLVLLLNVYPSSQNKQSFVLSFSLDYGYHKYLRNVIVCY